MCQLKGRDYKTMSKHVLLLRVSAIFALVGAFLGSHMAGSGDFAFRPMHAHILVVGWLSLFAFSTYYRLYEVPETSKLATSHTWSAIIGSFGLSIGMWLYYMKPIPTPQAFNMVFFIVGGTILLISFVLFLILTFKYSDHN